MNERIKALWEDSDTIKVCYPEQGSPVSVSATTLEAFAELIVKECARVVDNLTEMDNPIDYRNTHATGADVLQHFGVMTNERS